MARAVEILCYVPNLIGYARILLLLAAFNYMEKNYILATSFYIISSILDAFDGYAARVLNQSSKFGALLDMLTDRAATACLIMPLCHFYPKYIFLFQMWVFIDITSHWAHQVASIIRGDASHKTSMKDIKRHYILRLYYNSRAFLFFMCAMAETFFSSMYLLNFTSGPILIKYNGKNVGLFTLTLWISAPFMLLKTIISVIHLLDAAWNLACIDSECPLENGSLQHADSSLDKDVKKKI